jgi:hypothetical protein
VAHGERQRVGRRRRGRQTCLRFAAFTFSQVSGETYGQLCIGIKLQENLIDRVLTKTGGSKGIHGAITEPYLQPLRVHGVIGHVLHANGVEGPGTHMERNESLGSESERKSERVKSRQRPDDSLTA